MTSDELRNYATVVAALVAGNTAPSQIGTISLVQFINPTGL